MRKHISQKIREMRSTGTIAPSSKFLVQKILSKIDFSRDIRIAQLGFGTGVFTKEILAKISSKSSLMVFEINPKCRVYYEKIKDPRLNYIEDSAQNIQRYTNGQRYDVIISTLPLASLPKKIGDDILLQVKNNLASPGLFLQYQYSLYSKKIIEKIFGIRPEIDFELLNIPPAFIYKIQTP